MANIKRFTPSVPKYYLFLASALMWMGVGILLNRLAIQWLLSDSNTFVLIFALIGLITGLLINIFGFSKVASKNIKRIDEKPGKSCAFAFLSWKSYILVAFMMTLGISLRNSDFPKNYLAILYIAIGTGLFLSSFAYFKSCFLSFKGRNNLI